MTNALDADVIHESTVLSFEGNLPFPEVVKRLAGTGVERYYTDLVRLEKTFYGAAGATHGEGFPPFSAPPIADSFSLEKVREAISAIQKRTIDYPEFLRRIMAAGTASYSVYIAGRRAIYTGRNGDFHVELFPPAP